ncbi:M56 family metallopeptidase [Neobacillus cucumis]|uniref:M56 family metallopeptidase n=1 Tax=Neobacillus cucumis TaxID=1740721 RepID=UPI0028531790|nr:M56 family metallopeptidase [Neobacillus cucumis]MDR4947711.1 M56 family metallopeptidase [Neobacillus cucumis]
MAWKQKSTAVFGLALFFAIILFVQMGLYLLNIFIGPIEFFNIFIFCVSLFKPGTFGYYAIEIMVNTYILYTVFIISKKVIKQIVLLRSFRHKIQQRINIHKTSELNVTFNRRNNDIVVIHDKELLAFTFGFWKPKLVLSSYLIHMLDSKELEAVIYHETSHQKYYDGLKVFILQIISEVMWYIPLTKWSYQNFRILVELVADEFAIKRMGSELGLGGALLKLIKNQLKINPSAVTAVVHFADETVDYRLKQLVNPQQTIPVKIRAWSVIYSLNIFVVILFILVIA